MKRSFLPSLSVHVNEFSLDEFHDEFLVRDSTMKNRGWKNKLHMCGYVSLITINLMVSFFFSVEFGEIENSLSLNKKVGWKCAIWFFFEKKISLQSQEKEEEKSCSTYP